MNVLEALFLYSLLFFCEETSKGLFVNDDKFLRSEKYHRNLILTCFTPRGNAKFSR